jgi:hypothetical protein
MKSVIINSVGFDENLKYIMLEGSADVLEYTAMMNILVERKISSVMKSGIHPERIDHMCLDNLSGSLLGAGVVQAKIQGKNPLICMAEHAQKKSIQMLSYIFDGKTMLVNDVGGFCFFDSNCHSIVHSSPYVKESSYKIKTGTKYINLENDPKLESRAKDYLRTVDKKYSYIVNLSEHSEDELDSILLEFKQMGGEVVYVYTTGSNIQQMYDYVSSALKADISRFEFEFNAGIDDGIEEFLDYLADTHCASVKCNGNLHTQRPYVR